MTRLLVLGAAFLTCGPAAAWAQAATDLPADRLLGAPGPDTIVGVEGGDVLGHLLPDFGLRVGGLGRPFALRNTVTGEVVAVPVSAVVLVETVAAVGLWDRVQLGVAAPVTVYQSGDRFRGISDERTLRHGSGGDFRLHLKVLLGGRFLGPGRLTVAFAPFVAAPTGNAEEFAGVGGPWGEVRLAAGWRSPGWLAAVQVGARLRPETSLYGSREHWAGAFAAGVERAVPVRRLRRRLSVLGVLDGEAWGRGPRPLEARGGVRVGLGQGLSAAVAAGGGLNGEVGAPAWRALAELRLEPGP